MIEVICRNSLDYLLFFMNCLLLGQKEREVSITCFLYWRPENLFFSLLLPQPPQSTIQIPNQFWPQIERFSSTSNGHSAKLRRKKKVKKFQVRISLYHVIALPLSIPFRNMKKSNELKTNEHFISSFFLFFLFYYNYLTSWIHWA